MSLAVWYGTEDTNRGLGLAVRGQLSLCHYIMRKCSRYPRILNSNMVFVRIGGWNMLYLILC